MGTQVLDLGNTNIKLRLGEPYLSQGINQKHWGVYPRGVLRGFTVSPGVGNRCVILSVDGATSDSMAVIELSTGEQFRAMLASDTADIDLTAFAGQKAVLVLTVNYNLAATSEFVVTAYTEADYLADPDKDYLCAVGEVSVPAAAVPVVDGDISEHYRRWYFFGMPRGTDDWQRMGLGRSHVPFALTGSSNYVSDALIFNCPSLDPTLLEADQAGVDDVDGGHVLHFDMVPTDGGTVGAFYVPVTGRLPVKSGDRLVVDMKLNVHALTFNGAWGGTNRLGVRALFFDAEGSAPLAGEESLDLLSVIPGPPYSTVGYERFTATFKVPAGAVCACVYFEAFGMDKAGVWGDAYIKIQYVDVFAPQEARGRGREPALSGRPIGGTMLTLYPVHEPVMIARAYTDWPDAYPLDPMVHQPSAVTMHVDIEDGPAMGPVPVLNIRKLVVGGALENAKMGLRIVCDAFTRIGTLMGARIGTVGDKVADVYGGGDGGVARISNSGTGATIVATEDGALNVRATGTGDVSVIAATGGVSLRGNVKSYGPAIFSGSSVNGAVAPHSVVIREQAGAPALGGCVKLVEDILACVPPEDILFERYWSLIAPADFAVVGEYFTWVDFPYMYSKGGDPLDPSNWYCPGALEINVTGSILNARVASINVDQVSANGFLLRIVPNAAVVAGHGLYVHIKWKFVPI